jgi:hypothetical protein
MGKNVTQTSDTDSIADLDASVLARLIKAHSLVHRVLRE